MLVPLQCVWVGGGGPWGGLGMSGDPPCAGGGGYWVGTFDS